MWLTGTLVPALANHITMLDDDAADTGVRLGRVDTKFGQAQCLGHVTVVISAEHDGRPQAYSQDLLPVFSTLMRAALLRLRLLRRSSSRRKASRSWKRRYTEAKRT